MHRAAYLFLWILVFTIPWSGVGTIGSFGTISKIVSIPTFVLGVASAIYGGRWRFHTVVHGIAAAFALWAALSYFWSIDQDLAFQRVSAYAQLVVLMWIIFQCADTREKVEGLAGAYVVGALVAAGITIYSYMIGMQSSSYERYSAGQMNPNDLAYVLSLGVPMAWFLLLQRRNSITGWLWRLYPAIALVAVFLSGSRGGLMVTVLAASYFLLSYGGLNRIEKISLPLSAVIILVVVISNLPADTISRLLTVGSELSSGDLNNRTTIWDAGLMVLNHHWLAGVGAGNFFIAVVPYFGGTADPHNVYLSVLVDNGIIGLGLLLALVGAQVFLVAALPSNERFLWWVLLGVWCTLAFAANWEWRKETWTLFALLTAHAATILEPNGGAEKDRCEGEVSTCEEEKSFS